LRDANLSIQKGLSSLGLPDTKSHEDLTFSRRFQLHLCTFSG